MATNSPHNNNSNEMQVLVDIYVDRLESRTPCFENGERVYIKWTHLMKSGMTRVCMWDTSKVKFEDVFPTFVTVFTKDDTAPASPALPASEAVSSNTNVTPRRPETYHSKRIVFALYVEGRRHPNAKNSFLINGFLDRPTQKVSIHFKWEVAGVTHNSTLMVKMRVRRDYFDGEYGGEVPEHVLQDASAAWERASVTSHNSVTTDNLSCCSTLSGCGTQDKPCSPEDSIKPLRGYSKHETLSERNARLANRPEDKNERKKGETSPSPWLIQWIDNFRPNEAESPETKKSDRSSSTSKQRLCCFF